MAKLRFGIVGAGMISRISCRDIAAHPEVEIVAAADPSGERLEDLASRYGISRTYADAAALFDDAEVDAVYIAVPNAFHAEMARQALAANKHTILDKPFAMNITQAQSVAEAARATDRVFMVGMNQRFERTTQKMKKLVQSGALGDVYHAKAYWRRRSGIPRLGSWFTHREVSGGGALLDIGIHMLDAALYMMGNFRPVTVTGATYTRFGNRGLGEGGWGASEREFEGFDVDDFATALIRLEGDVTVTLDASWALLQEDGNRMEVELYGTEAGGAAYGDRLVKMGEGPGEYVVIQSPSVPELIYPHMSRFHNFINTILGTEQPCVTLDESLAVQRILDGIYESQRTGSEVSLKD